MFVTRNIVLKEIRDLIFFVLVSLVHSYLVCSDCTGQRYWHIFVFTFFMWVLLWKGNSLLSGFLSRKISWLHRPVKRFVVGILLTIGYTVLAVVSLIEAFEYMTSTTLGDGYVYTLYGA